MLETFEVNKVLIIAPLRVARDTWPAEIEKWDHLKGLDISVIVGDVKTRIAAVHHPAMIYIVNRENIKWLVEYYEKNGMRWDFGMVVIDELSSFKNYQSQRFKFLRKVRPFVKRWVGLTGTPSSNGLMDLWAEIGILDGGERLGKFIGRYREAYFKAGSMNPATGIVFQYVPRQGAEEMIYQRISDITISMKALDYLNMPDCVPTRYEVEMNTQERELYDMLRQDLLIPLKDGDIDAANAASLTGNRAEECYAKAVAAGKHPDAPKLTAEDTKQTILDAVTWRFDWIQQNKRKCYRFAEILIDAKEHRLVTDREENFVDLFVRNAALMPEPNRKLIDCMYEVAWYSIYMFKYGLDGQKVPAPWYDTKENDSGKGRVND